MITAKQAKDIADLVELKQYEEQTAVLSGELMRYAENGYYSLRTHLPLTDQVIVELEKNGFRTEKEQNGSFKIYW
jgi:hypothetical protein